MADQSLIKYIKDTQAGGFSEAQIRDAIKKQGWPQEEIDAAFNEIKAPKAWAPSFLKSTPAPAATPADLPAGEAGKPAPTGESRKPEIKPEIKSEVKPEPKIIPSVEALFGTKPEPLTAAKPTEAKPLVMPVEPVKTFGPTKPVEPKPVAPAELSGAKPLEPIPKTINYTVETPTKPLTVEQLVGAGDAKEPVPPLKEITTKTPEKIEVSAKGGSAFGGKQETPPEKIEPIIKKSKGPFILKIAVIVLSVALLALATYYLIFSPQLFVRLDWLSK